MKRLLCLVSLICVFAVAGIVPQSVKHSPLNNIPAPEPFKLKTGSSFSASGSSPRTSEQTEREKTIDNFSEALDVIRNNYAGGRTNLNDLTKSSITSALRVLDPHSNYFDPIEYQSLLEEEQSQYSGIGATIVNFEKHNELDTYVLSVTPGSPAERAGLKFGDRILSVDGNMVGGESSDTVRDKVRGQDRTPVKLVVERSATRRVENVVITRALVAQPSVPDYYILRPGVGYIDLTDGFNYTTADEVGTALKELHRQGMTSLIMDLRGNPGGILEQSIKVAERFLPAGSVIVSQRGRTRIDNHVWKSTNNAAETLPVVLLVDQSTASASEVLAGALQDHDRALIIGERTFGKGLVQDVINLPFGSGLTLTAARYYTPSGRSIQRDYSNGDIYDYFRHRYELTDAEKAKFETRTVTNRKVFGGDGILPDEVIKDSEMSAVQVSLLDPLFFFTVDLINGRVQGFESYKTDAANARKSLNTGDFAVSEKLLAAFRNYAVINYSRLISEQMVDAQQEFVKTRLHFNFVTATLGSTPAEQVLIKDDEQVAKAVEALPRAQQLALSALRARLVHKR
jgi:C-terminal peptidase (prc)